MASCDPNEMSHGCSPLCVALRGSDVESVELLLQYGANPSLAEPGHPDPIFLAIQGGSVLFVRLLLQHRANVDGHQEYMAVQAYNPGEQEERVFRRRSTFEAARNCPPILHMLQNAAHQV